MRLYSVHYRGADRGPQASLALVKEGFCWPAFFFAVPWGMWHRLWLLTLGVFAAYGLIALGAHLFGLNAAGGLVLDGGLALLIGLFANDLRRWALRNDGFEHEGVVAANGLADAEHRFLDARPDIRINLL